MAHWKDNPYSDAENFVDLGQWSIARIRAKGETVEKYDLYALVNPWGDISFGAKYGPEEHEYLSSNAHQRVNGEWDVWGSQATLMAAARYFANHHKERK